jgi:germacradienol/geosmin synthase
MIARMRQFERILATELPALRERHHLDEEGRKSLDQYVAQLQGWMASILNWHSKCDRYTEHGLLRRYGAGPRQAVGGLAGPGTTAARITGLPGSITPGQPGVSGPLHRCSG